jgi:hypothetical protein
MITFLDVFEQEIYIHSSCTVCLLDTAIFSAPVVWADLMSGEQYKLWSLSLQFSVFCPKFFASTVFLRTVLRSILWSSMGNCRLNLYALITLKLWWCDVSYEVHGLFASLSGRRDSAALTDVRLTGLADAVSMYELTREWSDPTGRNLPWFFFTARVHTTKSTVKILAAKTHCRYFFKNCRSYSFFCTRNRLYQRFVQPLI